MERVILRRGTFADPCPGCGQWCCSAKAEPQLCHVLALALIGCSGRLRGPEIRFVRLQSHVPQRFLAEGLRVRRATVADWERLPASDRTPGTELLLRAVLLRHFRNTLGQFGLHRLNVENLDFMNGIERRLIRDYDQVADPGADSPVILRWVGDTHWTID
jgi:DNA-binding transcriptional regulator YiaG